MLYHMCMYVHIHICGHVSSFIRSYMYVYLCPSGSMQSDISDPTIVQALRA